MAKKPYTARHCCQNLPKRRNSKCLYKEDTDKLQNSCPLFSAPHKTFLSVSNVKSNILVLLLSVFKKAPAWIFDLNSFYWHVDMILTCKVSEILWAYNFILQGFLFDEIHEAFPQLNLLSRRDIQADNGFYVKPTDPSFPTSPSLFSRLQPTEMRKQAEIEVIVNNLSEFRIMELLDHFETLRLLVTSWKKSDCTELVDQFTFSPDIGKYSEETEPLPISDEKTEENQENLHNFNVCEDQKCTVWNEKLTASETSDVSPVFDAAKSRYSDDPLDWMIIVGGCVFDLHNCETNGLEKSHSGKNSKNELLELITSPSQDQVSPAAFLSLNINPSLHSKSLMTPLPSPNDISAWNSESSVEPVSRCSVNTPQSGNKNRISPEEIEKTRNLRSKKRKLDASDKPTDLDNSCSTILENTPTIPNLEPLASQPSSNPSPPNTESDISEEIGQNLEQSSEPVQSTSAEVSEIREILPDLLRPGIGRGGKARLSESGLKGVYWNEKNRTWVASWNSRKEGGRRIWRAFSVNTYGYEGARKLAIQARVEAEMQGDSSPHGVKRERKREQSGIAGHNFKFQKVKSSGRKIPIKQASHECELNELDEYTECCDDLQKPEETTSPISFSSLVENKSNSPAKFLIEVDETSPLKATCCNEIEGMDASVTSATPKQISHDLLCENQPSLSPRHRNCWENDENATINANLPDGQKNIKRRFNRQLGSNLLAHADIVSAPRHFSGTFQKSLVPPLSCKLASEVFFKSNPLIVYTLDATGCPVPDGHLTVLPDQRIAVVPIDKREQISFIDRKELLQDQLLSSVLVPVIEDRR